MPAGRFSGRRLTFLLAVVFVVLLNAAGVTLFARLDLTRNRIYSLSEVSREVVATLSEPLTIHAFFSRNLPPPYNAVEQYLRDLLEEYAVHAGRFFNYRFHEVSGEEGEPPPAVRENQKLASAYGIHPVQVQTIEKDEVAFKRVYMGLVLIHGDLIEQIPALTTTDGLEYRITTAVQKMNHKISALLRLKEPIAVTLYLSPSLKRIAPLLGLKGLNELPRSLEETVRGLNARTYGKLAFRSSEPPDGEGLEELVRGKNLLALSWPASGDGKVAAGRGAIGLVVEHGERRVTLPLIDVVRLPILGTQYRLFAAEDTGRMINGAVESLLEIHSRLGVLAERGAASLSGAPASPLEDPQSFANFRQHVSERYTLQPVKLSEGPIPEDIACLLVVKPREAFSDWELYQLDQFLMRGKSLAFFLDPFEEVQAPGQASHLPIETGLEPLLAHYGVRLERAIVLDEHCYKQEMPPQLGGGERPLYYAPILKPPFIDASLPFLENLRSLVTVKAAPVEILPDRVREIGVRAHAALSTSERSWTMAPPINLHPLTLRPPADPESFRSRSIACFLEGSFPSYFRGKPLPVREAGKENAGDPPAEGPKPGAAAPAVEVAGAFLETGRPGRIFVMGTSEMLRNTLVDETGRGANSVFALNVVDALNGREAVARMRAKEQRFNPLADTDAATKTLIKFFAIVGLPVLVALAGLGAWAGRRARRRRIQRLFAPQAAEKGDA
ncbi:MAG: Gldg family protein [Desulfobacterales bacterium]